VTAHPRDQILEQVRNSMFCDSAHIVFPGDGWFACNPMQPTEADWVNNVGIEVVYGIALPAKNAYPASAAAHHERWDTFIGLMINRERSAARDYARQWAAKGWGPWIKIVDLMEGY